MNALLGRTRLGQGSYTQKSAFEEGDVTSKRTTERVFSLMALKS